MDAEQMARILMILSLSNSVRTWLEGHVSGDDAMREIHKSLLTYREAL